MQTERTRDASLLWEHLELVRRRVECHVYVVHIADARNVILQRLGHLVRAPTQQRPLRLAHVGASRCAAPERGRRGIRENAQVTVRTLAEDEHLALT